MITDPWEVRFDIVKVPSGDGGSGPICYVARYANGICYCDPWSDEEHHHRTPAEAVECLREGLGGRSLEETA